MSPYSWKPQLATWYPVRGLIKFFYHTLRQIWKNMIIVKPKVIGNFSPQDMARMVKDDREMTQVLDDMFIRLRNRNDIEGKGSGSTLEILQGEMRIKEWFDGAKEIYNYILECCGLSSQSDTSSMKTTSEIYAQQKTSSETIGLLRQLRADQWSRHFDKALIMFKFWDGEGERPYTLSIPDEENMNKSLEIEEAKVRMEANLSNPYSRDS